MYINRPPTRVLKPIYINTHIIFLRLGFSKARSLKLKTISYQFQVERPCLNSSSVYAIYLAFLPYSSSIQGFTLSFSTSVLVIFYLLSNVSFPFFISKRIILPSFWHKYIFLLLLGQIENFINLHNLRILNFLLYFYYSWP